MKEPISWQVDRRWDSHGDLAPYWDIVDPATNDAVAIVLGTKKPLVDKRNAQLIARAGRMQAAIKAVVTALDVGGEQSRQFAREIAILRQSLK
jgi:hypothetical protein